MDLKPVKLETDLLRCPECNGEKLHHQIVSMRILFWCEDCNSRPILVLYQSKGSTFMGWVWK